MPSMVTRPVIASIPKITRLNWRKVVVEISGAMGCKSARISGMGFCGWVVVRKTLTLPQKPYFIRLILAKVLLTWTIFILWYDQPNWRKRTMDEKITIIEGPPPTFEEVNESWVLGLNESPILADIALRSTTHSLRICRYSCNGRACVSSYARQLCFASL